MSRDEFLERFAYDEDTGSYVLKATAPRERFKQGHEVYQTQWEAYQAYCIRPYKSNLYDYNEEYDYDDMC